jgi:uracil-DNA glycosylase
MSFAEQLHPNWRKSLGEKVELLSEIEDKLIGENYLPLKENVLRSLAYDPNLAKVLILGQDPYPNSIDAMGLSFSTARTDGSLPASLKNIFSELSTDLGLPIPVSGDLTPWCDQGVVLLNRTLTCRNGESDSHRDIGWREFTDAVVKILADQGVVAILWGKSAQEVSSFFEAKNLITSVHPSPLSAYRGFFGSKPFSRANQALKDQGKRVVDWSL